MPLSKRRTAGDESHLITKKQPLALQTPPTSITMRQVRATDSDRLRATCWPNRTFLTIYNLVTRAVRNTADGRGLGLVVVGCFLPQQAGAAGATDIHSFVNCVNSMATVGATVADDASSCVPSGCYHTITMSEESPIAGITLRVRTDSSRGA